MPYMSRTNYYNIPAWGQDANKAYFGTRNMIQFGLYSQATYLINEKWYAGAAVFFKYQYARKFHIATSGI